MSVTMGTLHVASRCASRPAASRAHRAGAGALDHRRRSRSLFLVVFLVLPLVTVFQQAFARGIGPYLGALAHPDAVAAIRLTLLVRGDFGRCSI